MGRRWRPAPEGTCLGYDSRPLCEPVAAFAVEGEEQWVFTEAGQVLRVNRKRGDRLVFPRERT